MSVTLSSSDNQYFTIDKEVAEKSGLIRDMLDVCESGSVIPLPRVHSDALRKIIEYCEYHRNDPVETAEGSNDIKDVVIDDWDRQFIENINSNELFFDITIASNYLNIEPLLNLSIQRIADMIRGKTPEEIRDYFNIIPPIEEE